jgi:hypothetical protein
MRYRLLNDPTGFWGRLTNWIGFHSLRRQRASLDHHFLRVFPRSPRRVFSQIGGRLVVRAVPGRSPGDRRIFRLQYGGVNLRWSCTARLADCSDRRQPVAERWRYPDFVVAGDRAGDGQPIAEIIRRSIEGVMAAAQGYLLRPTNAASHVEGALGHGKAPSPGEPEGSVTPRFAAESPSAREG